MEAKPGFAQVLSVLSGGKITPPTGQAGAKPPGVQGLGAALGYAKKKAGIKDSPAATSKGLGKQGVSAAIDYAKRTMG